jgi:hypothetical protein
MNRNSFALLFLISVSCAAHADVIRPQCQTDESRGLRLASEAMYRAAADSQFHYPDCPNGCTLSTPSSQIEIMNATAERFRAEARASLYKARAAEAAKCPQWERAIMDNGPATEEEKTKVTDLFDAAIAQEWEQLAKQKAWQKDHPQCKHVHWQGGSGASKEDLSGKFEGKSGHCSVDGNGELWRGSDDNLKAWSPDTNPRLAKIACAKALQQFGFGTGEGMDDPKLCRR